MTSVVAHVIVGGGLAVGTLFVARKIMAPPPVEVELVVRPKPLPEPEENDPKERKNAVKPPPDAPKPEPRPRRPRARPRPQKILAEQEPRKTPPKVASLAEPPPPQPGPPMRSDEPVRPGPPAPTVFGLDMDSADTGGTFEVAQGNTVATSPTNTGPVLGDRGRPPGGGGPATEKVIPPPEDDTKITKWPARVDDLVFRYPENARRLGTEGSVKLRLSLDEDGKVVDAQLVKPADPLLDKTALEGVMKLKFSPAFAGKKRVACEIPYTFTFVLD